MLIGKGSKLDSILQMKCPKCQKSEPNTENKNQKENLDRMIRCPHCAKSSATKEWRCPCDTKWTLCEEHFRCAIPDKRSSIPGQMARCQTLA